MSKRIVVNFSCGAASAVAWKLAVEQFPDGDVVAINAEVADEDDDNRRFLADCEKWIGRPVIVLRDEKYGASAETVWRKKRFIVNRNGAPCSKALKRDVLSKFHLPDDLLVLGYTADESDRYDRFVDANPTVGVWAPLVDFGITKRECLERIHAAGIELPRMYRLGYHNANCPGCPKGGAGYWNKIRNDFPERFERMAQLQDLLGPGSYFLSDRRDGKRVRVSLRMLDPSAGRFTDEPPVECNGATCEWPQLPLFEDQQLEPHG